MYKNKIVSVIIAAAGAGSRMGGGIPKQYRNINGKPMLALAAEAFWNCGFVDNVCVVVNEDYDPKVLDFLNPDTILTLGGAQRQDSVYNGLRSLPKDTDIVLVHDGARPFVPMEVIERVVDGALVSGAAIPCIKPKDTIRNEAGTLDREEIHMVQTPQGFNIELILEAYEKAFDEGYYGTDDASLVDRIGKMVSLVQGSESNIKITTPEDIPCDETRIGNGYDLHTLVENRPLIIGGVLIPYEKGLLGHSDADVLVHALMDAILGAMGQGDIGKHFPDTSIEYKDISSLILLKKVCDIMGREGFGIINGDITLLMEKPKIAPYIEEMKKNIENAMKITAGLINIKATTMEGIGIVGREEGIACQASVLLKINKRNAKGEL